MANGSRMKREFAMMMKAQAGWDIGVVGTKRTTRRQNSPGDVSNAGKRRRNEGVNEGRNGGGSGGELLNSKAVGAEEEGDENVVMLSEDLEKSKVGGVEEEEELESGEGIVKRDENAGLEDSRVGGEELDDGNLVMLAEELLKSKEVGEEELESGERVVKSDGNVVMLSEDLAKSKVGGGGLEELQSGEGAVKRDENVVLEDSEVVGEEGDKNVVELSEDLLKSNVVVVGLEVLGSEEGVVNRDEDVVLEDSEVVGEGLVDENVVMLSDDLAISKVVVEELDSDGGVKKDGNVVLLSEELKTDVVDGNSEDEKKSKMDEEVVGCGEEGDAKTEMDKDEQKVLLQTPMRRFTRSSLRTGEDAKVSQSHKTDEVQETDPVGTMSSPAKMEMKMSKKVALMKNPTKLKELLETGLLEGLPVRYIRGSTTKGRGRPAKGLRGEIRGSGILCFCDNCDGTSVVTPNQFELHANSANKRPPEYIYLDNGKSLRDVLSMCKDAPSDEVEIVIKNAIGSAGAKSSASACKTAQDFKSTPVQSGEASNRSASSVPATKLTDRMPSGSGSQSKLHGKLTRKDLRMHKLVFEEGALPDGTALAYFVRGQKLLEGYKKGHGIYCYCCNTEVSPSQFEAHAGCASRRKPYLYIYTSNGVSLHELSIKLSKERRSSAEENDDLCSICADGGDLLCCDNCPRAFHAECVALPSIPTGTWYCKYCENMFAKERFVETNANAIAAGRVAGIDAIEQITKRCIRMVETLETEVSVCVLCRDQDFSKSGFGPRTVIICDQCEKEYHVGCLKEHNIDDLQELPKDKWFCCTDCNRIHFALENLVSDGEQNIPESLLKVLKEKNEGKDSENSSTLDIKWRLLSGKMSSEESRVWLSSAVSIFHEQFDPIADASTSRLDLIPHMVFGRNLKDQDYGGMFCAILLVNSLVVSAGIIRIFGKEVAELPLVATSTNCQGQGYFQSLFSCMENLLQSLKVEKLVLPSAEEAESIWTNRFSFTKISEEQLKNYRKDYQMMVFSGTSMLQKQVGGSQCDENN